MGIFEFMKGAGEKIFQPGDAKRETAIEKHLGGYGGDYSGVRVEVNGDSAILTGSVGSTAVREKAVLIAGNVDGIDKVDDRLKVTGAASPTLAAGSSAGKPDFSNVSGGVASTEAPIGAGSAGAAHASAGGEGWQSKTYTVKAGDSLSKIAKEFYGEAGKYNQIFEANQPMLKDPDKIYPGQVLRIPAEA